MSAFVDMLKSSVVGGFGPALLTDDGEGVRPVTGGDDALIPTDDFLDGDQLVTDPDDDAFNQGPSLSDASIIAAAALAAVVALMSIFK